MSVFRIFPLSVSILWRFCLTFPLWLVFYTIISLIVTFGLINFVGAIPGLGALALIVFPIAALALSNILTIHPYLIGMRIGLRTLGHKAESSHNQMLGAAVGYGLLESIVMAIFFSITLFFVWLFTTSGVELATVLALEQIPDPVTDLSFQIASRSLDILALVQVIGAIAIRAAFMPVFAGVAAGCTPSGHQRGFMDGFGSHFIGMVAVLVFVAILSSIWLPLLEKAAANSSFVTILLAELKEVGLFVLGDGDVTVTLAHLLLVFFAIFLSLWTFCLQCAAAAMSHDTSRTDNRVETATVPQQEEVDIRALLRERMPKRNE